MKINGSQIIEIIHEYVYTTHLTCIIYFLFITPPHFSYSLVI